VPTGCAHVYGLGLRKLAAHAGATAKAQCASSRIGIFCMRLRRCTHSGRCAHDAYHGKNQKNTRLVPGKKSRP
jgi:hypothetical protein